MATRTTIPEVLDLLARAVDDAPVDDLPQICGKLAELEARTHLRILVLARSVGAPAMENMEDVNISVEAAARRLGISPSYIYRNVKRLPFIVRIGRRVLCSARGLGRWNRRRMEA